MRWSDYVLQRVEGEEVWENLSNIPSKTTAQISSMGSATEVVGSNPAGEQIFFPKINTFAYMFFLN